MMTTRELARHHAEQCALYAKQRRWALDFSMLDDTPREQNEHYANMAERAIEVREQIIDLLETVGSASYAECAECVGLTETGVRNILYEMRDAGIVTMAKERNVKYAKMHAHLTDGYMSAWVQLEDDIRERAESWLERRKAA